MPSYRLTDSAIAISLYDVAGMDADTRVGLIAHIGLAAKAGNVQLGVPFPLNHMVPPIETDDLRFPVHVMGRCNLDSDEIRQIKVFLDEVASELQAQSQLQQYIIFPHFQAPTTGNSYRRFNCSGFVAEAYRYAGITLVDTNNLPDVDLATLKDAYPAFLTVLNSDRLRERLGLKGSGPWGVLMPAYILNSLHRDDVRASAYVARPTDMHFPSPL